MMLAFLPLAAVEDWLKFVIPLVFFIIYAINHLISAAKANASQTRNVQQRRKLEGAERPPRRRNNRRPKAAAGRHLADRHPVDRHPVDRHPADRHAVDRRN